MLLVQLLSTPQQKILFRKERFQGVVNDCSFCSFTVAMSVTCTLASRHSLFLFEGFASSSPLLSCLSTAQHSVHLCMQKADAGHLLGIKGAASYETCSLAFAYPCVRMPFFSQLSEAESSATVFSECTFIREVDLKLQVRFSAHGRLKHFVCRPTFCITILRNRCTPL